MVEPTSGTVFLDGRKVDGPPPNVIYVFQQYTRSLFPWKTVERNVAFGLENREQLSREADCGAHATRYISAGEAHRVRAALSLATFGRHAAARRDRARAACRPDVLLMDEPFSAVDALTRVGLQELLRSLWRELGLTVIFVTHDVDEGVYLSTRVVALDPRAGHRRDRPADRAAAPARPDRDARAAAISRLPGPAAGAALCRRRTGRDGGRMSRRRDAARQPALPTRRRSLRGVARCLWNTRWLGVGFIVVLLVAVGDRGRERHDALA